MEGDKIKKILFNEGSFIMGVVGVTLSVAFWVVNPQTALEKDLIKLQSQVENNETVSVALQNIKANDLHEIQLRLDRQETRQIELLQAVARLEVLLKQ